MLVLDEDSQMLLATMHEFDILKRQLLDNILTGVPIMRNFWKEPISMYCAA